jgi:N-acetylmuramoyl-L-alanine amidase-like protein
MAEQEELRLTVNLADNASAGLSKLNEEIKQLGSGAGQQHIEKFKRDTADLTTKVKGMSAEVGEAFKGLGMLRSGLALGGAGMALFGYELIKGTKLIVEYANQIRALNQAARQIGVNPGQYKDVLEQLKAFGIDGGKAASSLANISEKMADLQRRGSQVAQELRKNAGPDKESQANMEAYIQRLKNAQGEAQLLNTIREGGLQVEANAIKNGASEMEAADRKRRFWAIQGYDAALQFAGKLKELSKDEQRIANERQADAVKLANAAGQITQKWETLIEEMKQPFVSPVLGVLTGINSALDAIIDKVKAFNETRDIRTQEEKEKGTTLTPEADYARRQRLNENRRREGMGLPPLPAEKEQTDAIKKQTSATEDLTNLLKLAMVQGGGGGANGGIIPAAYSPGGGGPFGPRGGGGGRAFGGGGYANLGQSTGGYGGGAPNGQTAGPGTGAGAGSTPAQPSGKGPMVLGKGDDPRGMEAYIREAATREGVDPDTAVRVAKSEGLRDFLGDRGKSGGAFQLYTGGGLGNEFQKETGLNPLDPKNEKATIDYAMKKVKQTGWGPWHGAKRVGVGAREGLPAYGQTAGAGSGAGAGETPAGGTAAGGDLPPRVQAVGGEDPKAFITHHTGGRGTVAGVQNTLRQRGLGVQYVMDREGNIVQTGGPGASHMKTGWGQGAGLSNRNVVGMEIIARDDKDVTPAQAAAYARFMAERYPDTPIMGHGEVNPGHKEADEGMTAKRAALAERSRRQLDKSQVAEHKVTGSATIGVNVNAPKGTNVSAAGDGLFKKVDISRQTQMSEAPRGPKGGYATSEALQ